MGAQVEIVEVGPRDGLQIEPVILPTAAKIELITAPAGRRPAPHRGHQLRQPTQGPADGRRRASAGRARGVRAGAHFIGLVLNRKGFDRAAAAGCSEIGMVVVASDTFNRRNQGVGTDESIATWLEVARAARAAGIRAQVTISAAFGCPFEGEVPLARVIDVAQARRGRRTARDLPRRFDRRRACPRRSASCSRVRACRCPACAGAATSTTRAIPESPTPGPRSQTASSRWTRASAASAAVRSRLPRPATSPPKISLYMLERSGVETGVSLDVADRDGASGCKAARPARARHAEQGRGIPARGGRALRRLASTNDEESTAVTLYD